jgi:hypothetical protein
MAPRTETYKATHLVLSVVLYFYTEWLVKPAITESLTVKTSHTNKTTLAVSEKCYTMLVNKYVFKGR